MELRSYNVERVWLESVKCVIGEDLGVDRDQLLNHKSDIESMVSQVQTTNEGLVIAKLFNVRRDGETWTPYFQIVEMLIRMGKKVGVLTYENKLTPDTTIKVLCKG